MISMPPPWDGNEVMRFHESAADPRKNRVHLDVHAAPGLVGEERMAALETECAALSGMGTTEARSGKRAAAGRFAGLTNGLVRRVKRAIESDPRLPPPCGGTSSGGSY